MNRLPLNIQIDRSLREIGREAVVP